MQTIKEVLVLQQKYWKFASETLQKQHRKKNKQKMMDEVTQSDFDQTNDDKKQKQTRTFDVDDCKITMVEMVGHDNILRVTDDIKELSKEWDECELGPHDELEMFIG